jgi:hypothetical protein
VVHRGALKPLLHASGCEWPPAKSRPRNSKTTVAIAGVAKGKS